MVNRKRESGNFSTINAWLANIDLGHYAQCFEAANIDLEILAHLNESDLKEIGVYSLGHRRKILTHLSERVSHNPANPRAELRYITVLFCDLVGSTQWAELLGAEAFWDLLASYYAAVREAVIPLGGYVAQYHGDGVLVYFGYPNTLEDAALRGVLGASHAVEQVDKLPNTAGIRLAARAGVTSGPVLMDGLSEAGHQGEIGQAFGATVNMAARLQSVAQPGKVVVSESTAALVKHHVQLHPLGIHSLKGVEKPCAVFEIRGEQTGDLAVAVTAQQVRAPFVGRTEEIASLSHIWLQVESGAFERVLLTGEPGIGKSRLASHFMNSLENRGLTVRRIFFQPHSRDIPFHAFVDALKLEAHQHEPGAASLLELLKTIGSGSQMERRERRAEFIDALVSHFSDGKPPRIIWCDDIHWADLSSAEVISRLVKVRSKGVLIVISGRHWPIGMEQGAELREGFTVFQLEPLATNETKQIIAHLMSNIDADRTLFEMLADRSEGVPLFAEELALGVRESTDSGQRMDPLKGIPSSLQQSLQARIGRLTVANQLMRLQSCFGRRVSLSLLRSLWLSEEQIEVALEEITSAGLAELQLAQGSEQENMLVCRHQLILECAYEMILKRDRIAMHGRIADVLEQRVVDGIAVPPLMRAEHSERAERLREAADLYAQAGHLASAQSADAEAVSLYSRALTLAHRLENTSAEWNLQFEADTLLALYPALVGVNGYVAANADVTTRLEELIPRLGGPERLLSSFFLRWLEMLAQGDIDTAHGFTFGVAGAFGPEGESSHELMIHRMLGSTHMFRGELEAAKIHLHSFLNKYRPEEHLDALRRFGATDNYVTVLCCIAAIAAFDDDNDYAQQARRRAIAAADASRHVHTLCHTLCFGAALPTGLRGEWEELAALHDRLSTIAQERQLVFWQCFARMIEGILIASRGDAAGGLLIFNKGHDDLQARGFQFMCPTFRLVLAFACNGALPEDELAKLKVQLEAGERWGLPLLSALKARMESTPSRLE
jgi:class 3 adenylate cyclase/Cdc6-like AAA superfamily ATPase